MPIQEMMLFQAYANKEENMRLQLAIHCAPLLKGVKIANIMTVRREEFEDAWQVLEGTGVQYCFLKEIDHRVLMYLYRKERIEGYLRTKQISLFLEQFGYTKRMSAEEMLEHLAGRIQVYKDGETDFPHEMGLFLGYPLSDVIGFMDQEGKPCLYIGYWKVYDHLNSKLRLFRRYDEIRENAIRDVLLGKTIREIAAS